MSLEARSRIGVVSEGFIYLDNAGAGPLPVDTVESVKRFVDQWFRSGEPWIEGLEAVESSKKLFADLVKVSPDEIAATPGLTYGLNSLLSSLDLDGTRDIIVSDANFPTSIYTAHSMKRAGLVRNVIIARVLASRDPDESIEKLINDRTALVLIDHVSWISGYRFDIRRIVDKAHRHGALVAVDGFHAVGVIPVDLRKLDVDFYLTGSYKWLMSLHGAGFVYVRRDLIDRLNPKFSGWFSVEDSPIKRLKTIGREMFKKPFDIERLGLARDASILEWGTGSLVSFAALESSLRFLLRYNAPEYFETHTRVILKKLYEELSSTGYNIVTPDNIPSGILVFRVRDSYEIADRLSKNKIVVSPRPGVIRVSPHFYNTREEIEILVEELKSIDSHGRIL